MSGMSIPPIFLIKHQTGEFVVISPELSKLSREEMGDLLKKIKQEFKADVLQRWFYDKSPSPSKNLLERFRPITPSSMGGGLKSFPNFRSLWSV